MTIIMVSKPINYANNSTTLTMCLLIRPEMAFNGNGIIAEYDPNYSGLEVQFDIDNEVSAWTWQSLQSVFCGRLLVLLTMGSCK